MKDNAFEVTLEVRSYAVHQAGPARIFTVSHDNHNRDFTVGQSNDGLVVRLRTGATSVNGAPEYVVREIFRDPAFHRIAISVRSEEIRIKVDGRQRLTASLPPNALSTWNRKYRLALGNEFTFSRPWRGEVRAAAVHVRNKDFTYTAAGLQIPQNYDLGSKAIVSALHRFLLSLTYVNIADWVINLAGFVPFGFVLALARQKSGSLKLAFAWSGALSLSIEFGQFFFQLRYPQASDLVLNTLGGTVGAWIVSLFLPLQNELNGRLLILSKSRKRRIRK